MIDQDLRQACFFFKYWESRVQRWTRSTSELSIFFSLFFHKCKASNYWLLILFKVGKGSRGDVTILPTIMINNKQPRGERSKDVLLERSVVLKDLCSGFSETTEPHICLNKGPLYPSYTYLYLINTNFNVWFCDCAGRHRNQRVFAKQWRVLGG